MQVLPASQHGNSLRRAAGQLAALLLRSLGKTWAEAAGIDESRGKAWAGSGDVDSQKKQLPLGREIFLLCYLAGVTPEVAALVCEGRWHGELVPTDTNGIEDRLERVSEISSFKVKGYREQDIEQVLDSYTQRFGSAKLARRILKQLLGLKDFGDIHHGDVALPLHSDAALARMLGRPISLHWALRLVVCDEEYLSRFDAAHRAIGREEDDLIEAAVGGLSAMVIGDPLKDGQDFVFCPLPEAGPRATVRDLVRPHYIGQSFVVEGSEGRKILFNVRECRIDSEAASEASVASTLYYRARMSVANKDLDPMARPRVIWEQHDSDTIEGLLLKVAQSELLLESVETRVLGVKIPTYEAETMALTLGVPVLRSRAGQMG